MTEGLSKVTQYLTEEQRADYQLAEFFGIKAAVASTAVRGLTCLATSFPESGDQLAEPEIDTERERLIKLKDDGNQQYNNLRRAAEVLMPLPSAFYKTEASETAQSIEPNVESGGD